MTTFTIPGTNGPVQFEVSPARPLFVLGRNGTGKSALIHRLRQQLGVRGIYLPGSRTSVFDGEGLAMTPLARRQLTSNLNVWDTSPDARWKITSGNARNEKAVHDLTATEIKYKVDAANAISNDGEGSLAIRKLQAKSSPLDKVNQLLRQANLPVRMTIDGVDLKSNQDSYTYSFAKMSDGERTALILISEVISAPADAVFLIDEPELHLHRAIVVSLLASLIKERPENEFIVSTHELDLPSEMPNSQICIARSVKWGATGTAESWDVDIIEHSSGIPEDLRVDLLGSRRKVLFTEGTETSLDRPMYAILFPKISVRPKGSCRNVVRAVTGLRSTNELHHAEAFGIIDSDGMSAEQISKYTDQGIFPLSSFSIESIYYSEVVLESIAHRQAETLAIGNIAQLEMGRSFLVEAKSNALKSIDNNDCLSSLASRVAERQLRDSLFSLLPSRADMIAGEQTPIEVNLPNPYANELVRLKALVASGDLHGIISRYPLRETGALDAIAKALKFSRRSEYELAVLSRISADEHLNISVRGYLSPISDKLQ